MIHLHVIAEGATELRFFNKVIAPHLVQFNVYGRCQLTHTGGTKDHPKKGGLGYNPRYRPVKRALEDWIRQDRQRTDVWYTTMLDLYAFPKDSESPYTPSIQAIADPYRKVQDLETAMFADLGIQRFIPYVQLHEFETFLMVDPSRLSFAFPGKERALRQLAESIAGIQPERINERPSHAPSKRIIAHLVEYEDLKATVGPQVAGSIGLPALREACPHFNEWLTKLEQLGTP